MVATYFSRNLKSHLFQLSKPMIRDEADGVFSKGTAFSENAVCICMDWL